MNIRFAKNIRLVRYSPKLGGQPWHIAQNAPTEVALQPVIVTSDKSVAEVTSLPTVIADNWTRLGKAGLSVSLYSRLLKLAAPRNEHVLPRKAALRKTSLKDFLEFWMQIRQDAVEPELTLAPDGCLYAEWYRSPHRRLDVKFSDRVTHFGVIDGRRILEGAETLSSVASILRHHHSKPLKWQLR